MKKRSKTKLPKIGKKIVRSQFEYGVFQDLQNKLPNHSHIHYEAERIPYTLAKNYIPDFLIEGPFGTIYVEAKGLGRAFDGLAREKLIAVKVQNPDKDIRLVFMSDRPFRKGGRMRPSDWATKYGFQFSIKTVPESWFTECLNKKLLQKKKKSL